MTINYQLSGNRELMLENAQKLFELLYLIDKNEIAMALNNVLAIHKQKSVNTGVSEDNIVICEMLLDALNEMSATPILVLEWNKK